MTRKVKGDDHERMVGAKVKGGIEVRQFLPIVS